MFVVIRSYAAGATADEVSWPIAGAGLSAPATARAASWTAPGLAHDTPRRPARPRGHARDTTSERWIGPDRGGGCSAPPTTAPWCRYGRADVSENAGPIHDVPVFGVASTISERFAIGVVTHLPVGDGAPLVERAVPPAPERLADLLPGWRPLASRRLGTAVRATCGRKSARASRPGHRSA